MGMQVQSPPPGMQCHQYTSGDPAVLAIRHQFQKRLLAGLEQKPRKERFVVPPQREILMRQGKDNVKVRGVEQSLLLLLDPLKPFFIGAQGAASVSAGVIMFPLSVAFWTPITAHAHVGGLPLRERINRFKIIKRVRLLVRRRSVRLTYFLYCPVWHVRMALPLELRAPSRSGYVQHLNRGSNDRLAPDSYFYKYVGEISFNGRWGQG